MSERTMIQLLDPTAEINAPGARRAPRMASLAGARIGALDNGKWNSGRLLDDVVRELAARHGAAAGPHGSKPRYNLVVEPPLADTLAETSSAMVIAIGD
jgi:hypothetical protein